MAAAAAATVVGAIITAAGSVIGAAMTARDEQSTYADAALEQACIMKREWGNGVSTMINIYNATGSPALLEEQASHHGHVGRYPFEPRFGNGLWAVCLHVKAQGAALGSEGAVVYRVKNAHGEAVDVFIGWSNPYMGDNKVLVQCRGANHWWAIGSKSHMEHLTSRSALHSSNTYNGICAIASIGQDSTAVLRVYLGLEE